MVGDEFWVFGYGSLIWQPGFDFVDKRLATLRGWRRAFCMRSIMYRGTPEAPGLVLALDRDAGGSCTGVAYRVPGHGAAATLAYLRARELVSDAYDEVRLPVELDDGAAVRGGGLRLEPRSRPVLRRAQPRGSGRGDRPRRGPARA